ncbi:MAG: sigma-70 family RNA polymerase sigma factor [Polyangiaceae bacterium]
MPREDVVPACHAALLTRAGAPPPEEVMELLASVVERGLEGVEGFEVTARELADAIVTRIPTLDEAGLLSIRGADVALAVACAAGRADAIARFDATFGAEIPRVIERTRNRSLDPVELRGAAFERLFTGPRPKIADYSGAGDLRSWLRTLLVRLSLDLSRKRVELPAKEPELDEVVPSNDAEVDYLKGLYRGAFKAAFEEAAAALDADERNLLRMHFVHGRTIDELAALFRAHRATIARRIGRARDELVAATKRTLMRDLRLDRAEYDSVLRLIESDVHVSLSRVLRDAPVASKKS